MKVVITSESIQAPVEYEDVDVRTIEAAAAEFGRTDDTVKLYDDDNLVSYAVWKQGHNHYSFCRNPLCNEPCEWDILKA